MADNYSYVKFSEIIDNLTAEEMAWLDLQLDPAPGTDCPVFLADYPDRDPGDTDCGFRYSFIKQGSQYYLWVHSDEESDGNSVTHVAHLVQKFLQRFRPDQCWSLTYATTCPKLFAGKFGGGSIFVTANEIVYQSAHQFVEQQRAAFQQRRSIS